VTDLFTYLMSIFGALPVVMTGTRSGGAAYVPRIEPNLLSAGATSRVLVRGEYTPLNDGVGGETSRLLRKRSRLTQASSSSSRVSLSSSMVMGVFFWMHLFVCHAPTTFSERNYLFPSPSLAWPPSSFSKAWTGVSSLPTPVLSSFSELLLL
jgi:hypothetical protein